MLRVFTEVKPSKINGLGLFATNEILKGTVVWSFHPKIDQIFSFGMETSFPQAVEDQLKKYSYVNPHESDRFVLCGDDARFLNFPSEGEANLALGKKTDGENNLFAARDIKAGEELTVPVESDLDAERKLGKTGAKEFGFYD